MVRNGMTTDLYVFMSAVMLADFFSSGFSLGVTGTTSADCKSIDNENRNEKTAMAVTRKRSNRDSAIEYGSDIVVTSAFISRILLTVTFQESASRFRGAERSRT